MYAQNTQSDEVSNNWSFLPEVTVEAEGTTNLPPPEINPLDVDIPEPDLPDCVEGSTDGSKVCKGGKWVCNKEDPNVCCGVKLNTNVPFIGNCINIRGEGDTTDAANGTTVDKVSAFPRLMWWLTKIMVTLILAVSFLMVIVAGVLMVIWWADSSKYKSGIEILKTVGIALAVLGTSGIVLRLINPNFFGG